MGGVGARTGNLAWLKSSQKHFMWFHLLFCGRNDQRMFPAWTAKASAFPVACDRVSERIWKWYPSLQSKISCSLLQGGSIFRFFYWRPVSIRRFATAIWRNLSCGVAIANKIICVTGLRFYGHPFVSDNTKQPVPSNPLGWCGKPLAALWFGTLFLGLPTTQWTSRQLRSAVVAVNILNER